MSGAAAAALGATRERLSADDKDITRIERRARGSGYAAPRGSDNLRPEVAGYFMLPLIALLTLAWARRGWVVR